MIEETKDSLSPLEQQELIRTQALLGYVQRGKEAQLVELSEKESQLMELTEHMQNEEDHKESEDTSTKDTQGLDQGSE